MMNDAKIYKKFPGAEIDETPLLYNSEGQSMGLTLNLPEDESPQLIQPNSREYGGVLTRLTKEHILLRVIGATHDGDTPSRLSSIKNSDPFHIDTKDFLRRIKSGRVFAEFITCLSIGEGDSRITPTYYSTPREVKEAFNKLDVTGCNGEVQQAIEAICSSEYSFCQYLKSRDARRVCIHEIPQVTELVFDLIPDKYKHQESWNTGRAHMVFHLNTPKGEIVHGRPENKGDAENCVTGEMLRTHVFNPLERLSRLIHTLDSVRS